MTAMNVEYTCAACGSVQTVEGAKAGEPVRVPQCTNTNCSAEPQWGAITLSTMKAAVVTVAQTHPQNTAAWTAVFILRLLTRVRPIGDENDADAIAGMAAQLDALARR